MERYVQQACISNLLVTVFAAHRIGNSLITNIFNTTSKIICNTPARKELTAGSHNNDANTAP
jgi:hypothetical protein